MEKTDLVIAIHRDGKFAKRWTDYCIEQKYNYRLVDCSSDNIIEQVRDCSVVMWHFQHYVSTDVLIANQLLNALEHSGMIVFPDFNSRWHFDDKLAQKYLFEVLDIKTMRNYAFYDKHLALDWAVKTEFPKVFKLRRGAGAINVRLVKSASEAKSLISRGFSKGFGSFDGAQFARERLRMLKLRRVSILLAIKGLVRALFPPSFTRILGRQYGYMLFQDFAKNNDHDIRVIVIDRKAIAIKRMVRDSDFRASGSGDIRYAQKEFDPKVLAMSFEIAKKIRADCIAMDFVRDGLGEWAVLEVSYGFNPAGYDACPGYWTEDLFWHEGVFNIYGWMVEAALRRVKA